MPEGELRLTLLEPRMAVCQLDRQTAVPAWAMTGEFWSLTRTADELSVVCTEQGPLDFGMVGVLAGLTAALAEAGISIFAVSTYDTDYLLVKSGDAAKAVKVLRAAGYVVNGA